MRSMGIDGKANASASRRRNVPGQAKQERRRGVSPMGRPEGENRSAQREGTPMTHPARGPMRSMGIDGKANASASRRRMIPNRRSGSGGEE